MRTSRLLFLAFMLPAPAVLAIAACDGKSLDVGTNNAAAPVTIDGDVFVGFAVDDIACTLDPTTKSISFGSDYKAYFDATCGAVGRVHAVLRSDLGVPYPQACGAAVELDVNFENETDATLLGSTTNATGGGCTVLSGPTASAPDATLSFTATVVGSGSQHRVKYVGNPARVIYEGTDTGPSSNIDSGGDTSSGVDELSPGPGRPVATACGSSTGCTVDTDCSGATTACGCDLPTPTGSKNLCLTLSTCRTDSDCGSGQRCARSVPAGTTFTTGSEAFNDGDWALGYFCTTPADACSCPSGTNPGYSCVFSTKQQHWACYGNP